jgi:hypothetical protein
MDLGPIMRTLGAVIAVCGTLGAGAKYIGESIYDFAKVQTLMIEHIKGAEKAISGLGDDQKSLKAGLVQEHADAATAAGAAMSAAKNAADAIPPLRMDIEVIKTKVEDIQQITKSHDEDIKVTRNAVAPKSPMLLDGHH